jgi:WD40 repeat protein
VHNRAVALNDAILTEQSLRPLSQRALSHVLLHWRASKETPQLVRVLTGHAGGVTAVAVTPDGRHAVSGSYDHTVRVWDLSSGAPLHTLEGHADAVWAVAVTPDGRHAVSGSRDRTVRVWDLSTGDCVALVSVDAGALSLALAAGAATRLVVGDEVGGVACYELRGLGGDDARSAHRRGARRDSTR